MLTEDCPVGWSAIKRRMSTVAGVALSMTLGICGDAFAQSPRAPAADGKKTVANLGALRGVSGTVMDSTGAVIVSATVKLVEITKYTELKGVTDERGAFQFTAVPMAFTR